MHRWDPETYEKSSSAQQTWAQELLSKISIRGDERILDIGCGDGRCIDVLDFAEIKDDRLKNSNYSALLAESSRIHTPIKVF